jgi:hypothetical protein
MAAPSRAPARDATAPIAGGGDAAGVKAAAAAGGGRAAPPPPANFRPPPRRTCLALLLPRGADAALPPRLVHVPAFERRAPRWRAALAAHNAALLDACTVPSQCSATVSRNGGADDARAHTALAAAGRARRGAGTPHTWLLARRRLLE